MVNNYKKRKSFIELIRCFHNVKFQSFQIFQCFQRLS